MSETFTGAICMYSDRDGSPFQATTQASGALGSNLIAPLHSRIASGTRCGSRRTGCRSEPLTLQFFMDYADDRYSGRDGSGLGPRKERLATMPWMRPTPSRKSGRPTLGYNRNEARADQVTCESASLAAFVRPTPAVPSIPRTCAT